MTDYANQFILSQDAMENWQGPLEQFGQEALETGVIKKSKYAHYVANLLGIRYRETTDDRITPTDEAIFQIRDLTGEKK